MQKTILIILFALLITVSARGPRGPTGPRNRPDECTPMDWSLFIEDGFNPINSCLDSAEDPTEVEVSVVQNSNTCSQHPFMNKARAYACSIIDEDVQQEMHVALNAFEANEPIDSDSENLFPCSGSGKTCCTEDVTSKLAGLLKAWVNTKGQKKSVALMNMLNMDLIIQNCSGDDITSDSDWSSDSDSDDDGEYDGENWWDAWRMLKMGQDHRFNSNVFSHETTEEHVEVNSRYSTPSGSRGHGGPVIQDNYDFSDDMIDSINHMLAVQAKMLVLQTHWLRSNLCALCTDPNDIETFFQDGSVKVNKDSYEHLLDQCYNVYDEINAATISAADQFILDIFDSVYKSGKENICADEGSIQDIRDYIQLNGFMYDNEGEERTKESFCLSSFQLFYDGTMVNESVEEIDEDEEVLAVVDARRRLSEVSEIVEVDSTEGTLTAEVEDPEVDETIVVDGVTTEGVDTLHSESSEGTEEVKDSDTEISEYAILSEEDGEKSSLLNVCFLVLATLMSMLF